MKAGSKVEVRSRYDGSWVRGFEVAEIRNAPQTEIVIRRSTDRTLLPSLFALHEVRDLK